MSPRLKVLYLVAVAVGVFVVRDVRAVGVVLGLQLVLWYALRNPARQPFRLVTKLFAFFSFILLTFAFFPDEGVDPQWFEIPVAAWKVSVSLASLRVGALMCLRIYTVVFTSMLVRRSLDSEKFVQGLRGVFLPEAVALTLDTTLHLLSPEERQMEHGSGMGKRRKKGSGVSLKQILKGDLGFFLSRIEESLEKGRTYAESHHKNLTRERASDIAVISGIALTMLTLKWIKTLPGLPFAPGHKTVLLLPLYLIAAELTHTRWGGTLVGACMGILGFLQGDGRYGIFEILKHIAPGLIIDLLHPLVKGKRGLHGAFRYGLIGLLAAVGRFATIVVIASIMGAPEQFFALVAPLALVHLGFGAASGVVSFAVMRSLGRLREKAGLAPAAGAVPSPSATDENAASSEAASSDP